MAEPNGPHRYTAIRLVQQPGAPIMYLMGVDASDLLEWADVPNAKADYMAGYQRVYNKDRAAQIADFLASDGKNIIPGAVVVTVSGDAIRIVPNSGTTGTDEVVTLEVTLAVESFESRLERVYNQFYSRLGEDERTSIETTSKIDAVLEGTAQSEAESNSSGDDEESGLPESYLAALAAELKAAVENWKGIPATRRAAITNYVNSVSKPGLIIDGQHRVFGAKDVSDHAVTLPVVLLPELQVAEQVFHFYVLNNKAKPLSPVELRRTVSTSLTNREIDDLWVRFEGAGIDPEAARWTFKLNTDARSPFKDLIDFGLGGQGFIKENVAYQVVSKFVKMPRKYRALHKDVPAWNTGNADDRLAHFYAFWTAIMQRYPSAWKTAVDNQGGQILYKASFSTRRRCLSSKSTY